MSEFKYACPVCGQHLKCDSSQSGSVMECPTCFQKITVPQSPATEEQKFILTGTKVSEKKYSLPVNPGGGIAPEKKSRLAAVFTFIMVLAAAGAGVFFLGGKHAGKMPAGMASIRAWQPGDVGDVGAAGSVSQSNGVFTLDGSGADIWHRADGFFYVYQPLDGDGSLTAKILSLKNTDEWAKSGVMIRESTNASAVFVLASLRADGQAQSIWRSAAGEEAAASALLGGPGYPKWVKIERNGNSFAAYFKSNAGDAWTQLGATQTVNMPPTAQIGFFVCSHNAGILSQAKLDQVTLEAASKPGPAKMSSGPKHVAPPASDTNWTLNLDAVTNCPDTVAVGRIRGQNFICTHTTLQGGTLTLRGADSLSLAINFSGTPPEALAGQTINVTTNADTAVRVTLRWETAGQHEKESFKDGYAMRLELGALANGSLPGKIYFCAPDNLKSYIMGTFTAEIRKPKQKK